MAAYEAYLMGRYYWSKLSEKDLDKAMQYFELAKEKDPEFALAYAGIGWVWCGRRQMGLVSPAEATPMADRAIMKAIELDSNHCDVQYILAGQLTWGKFDWKGGESAFRKTIELNPNHAEAHAYYSHLLNILGRPDEAMKHIDIALNLDPLSSLIKALYGIDLMFVRRYDEAVKAFQESLELNPTQGVAYSNLSPALYLAGREKEAVEMRKIRQKNNPEYLKAFEEGYAEAGWTGAHKKVGDMYVKKSETTYVSPYVIANNYAFAGDIDNAIYWLKKAYEERNPNLPYLLQPRYDKLRDDPRFQDLCRKMNLPYK
jgi:tetratricopeptide (TPR) repeat protein